MILLIANADSNFKKLAGWPPSLVTLFPPF
jgi:hypothetical protein